MPTIFLIVITYSAYQAEFFTFWEIFMQTNKKLIILREGEMME